MIRYQLKCEKDHLFDAWFKSSDAYDEMHAAGQVSCAVCGSCDVTKALMAPRPAGSTKGALSQPGSAHEAAMAQLKAHLDANSEDVGARFAQEARAMHDGSTPERAIHGQARLDEAKALIDDGIPVAPLPFLPKDKQN